MARTILTDAEWKVLEPFIPDNKGKKGRPSQNHRLILEAILWVLRTGAPWRDIPQEFGSWNTVYTRFRRWIINGVWVNIWNTLKKTPMTNHTFLMQQLSKSINMHVVPLQNRLLIKR
jgi:transposase